MGILKLSSQAIDMLQEMAPQLRYDGRSNIISGSISFDLRLEDNNNRITIKDTYQIEIDLNNVSRERIPVIKETSGRILGIAQRKGLAPADLHIGDDGAMCIINPIKIRERYPNGFDLAELIKHIQEHLYWVSYFEKYDKEPWEAYGHGEKGILEAYLENTIKYSKDFFDFLKVCYCCNSRTEMRRVTRHLRKKYKV
ncbi:MAG: hypothetical protein LBK61_11440 [Spirochaetaceae bacterium]|jgi:hypothetical protein|nr:hypothetical protein [Spirochaetaceae bacterium]